MDIYTVKVNVGKYVRTSMPNLGYPEGALAKNYGEPLENAGFDAITEHYNGEGYENLPDGYTPQAGDVAVFQDYTDPENNSYHKACEHPRVARAA